MNQELSPESKQRILNALLSDPEKFLDSFVALILRIDDQNNLIAELEEEISGFTVVGGIYPDLSELEREIEIVEEMILVRNYSRELILQEMQRGRTPTFSKNPPSDFVYWWSVDPRLALAHYEQLVASIKELASYIMFKSGEAECYQDTQSIPKGTTLKQADALFDKLMTERDQVRQMILDNFRPPYAPRFSRN